MPVLDYSDHNNRFYCLCTFAERTVPKAAGFLWDETQRQWYTKNPAVAVKLREYGNSAAKSKLNLLLIQVKPWLEPLPPPPNNLKLLPFQEEAIKFALSRNRCYLRLAPGLGKTIIAARIAATLKKPVVYISPPSLTRNVEIEFKRWAPGIKVMIVSDSMINREKTQADIVDFASEKGIELLFVDEAHRFKNIKTARTEALLGVTEAGIIDCFNRIVYMSGTPLPNGRPMELYPILTKSASETIGFMSKFDFGRRYCAGHKNQWGWDFSGASNLEELHKAVIAPTGPFMLRMDKDELDLPPKIEEVFVVSKDMSVRLAKMDRSLGEKYKDIDDLIKAKLSSDDELHIATYRKLLGEQKVPLAVEYLESILEETEENILVYAFHKKVIADLKEKLRLWKPLIIVGNTPMKERQQNVVAFQAVNSRHRLMIGNYKAMGEGFTLTKATRVFFVEFSWVPGENDQATDRPHRIGQKNTVLVQYMCYKDSLDKLVLEALLKKRRAIEQL